MRSSVLEGGGGGAMFCPLSRSGVLNSSHKDLSLGFSQSMSEDVSQRLILTNMADMMNRATVTIDVKTSIVTFLKNKFLFESYESSCMYTPLFHRPLSIKK